ncbi:MAG: hypothetical protein WCW02_03255 [Candidatus Buchananbacteria bacterium]
MASGKNKNNHHQQKPTNRISWLENIQQQPLAYRKTLLYTIVGLLTVGVLIFWFSSLRLTLQKSLTEAHTNNNQASLFKQFSQAWQITKQTWSDNLAKLQQAQATPPLFQKTAEELAAMFNTDNWSTTTSANLKLTLKHPTDWLKQDLANGLVIKNPQTATTSPNLAKIEIILQPNPQQLTAAQWYAKQQQQSKVLDQTLATSSVPLAQTMAFQRILKTESTEINQKIIYLASQKFLYEIYLTTTGLVYQQITEEILKSLTLLK